MTNRDFTPEEYYLVESSTKVIEISTKSEFSQDTLQNGYREFALENYYLVESSTSLVQVSTKVKLVRIHYKI